MQASARAVTTTGRKHRTKSSEEKLIHRLASSKADAGADDPRLAMFSASSTMQELDEVTIPAHIAERLGIVAHGTIVWYVEGADHSTVECAITGDNADGLETKLVDMDINALRLR